MLGARVVRGAWRVGAGRDARGAGRLTRGVARGAGRLGAGRDVDGRAEGRLVERLRWAVSGRLISRPSSTNRMDRRVVMGSSR